MRFKHTEDFADGVLRKDSNVVASLHELTSFIHARCLFLEFSGRDEPQVARVQLWEAVQLHCPSDCFLCTRRHSPSCLMAEFHLCGSAQNVTLCRLNFSQGTRTYCQVYVQHSFLSLEVIENIKGTRHLYGFASRNKDLLLLQFVLQLWTFTHSLNLTLPSAKKRLNAQLVPIKKQIMFLWGELHSYKNPSHVQKRDQD